MNAMPKNLIEMRGIKLKIEGKMILDGIDLTLYENEVLVLMGLSGGGKSTLLSIITGLLKPDEGALFILGTDEDLIKATEARLNEGRTHLGMVYQNGALISSMNVHDNVALPLRELTDKNAKEIDAIVDQKLELVGLDDAQQKLPSELSGGMQKRVGLARALVLEPRLVLFDEPTAGLDPIHSGTINELIIQLRDKQKVTALVVTHELESAFAIASRMAFLDDGKIILQGTPDEFRASDIPVISQFFSSYLKLENRKE
jgi:phospholipid/cholesterol/gamma-HCH transport system ATP-binding protein